MPMGVEPPLKKKTASREEDLVISTRAEKVLGNLRNEEDNRVSLVPR